ncbi:MAG: right-handed parallel beta-helix repeat-containing protein [Fimbriimonadaceae bacterium]|nr:right-handed parallel beta-helix repeat-containing protein [Fimbriimonadaceae bacterium]
MAYPSRRDLRVGHRWIGLLAALLLVSAGHAQTITVTTNRDLNNAQDLGFGKSLRDALNEANSVGGSAAVVIDFDPNVFVPNGVGAANTIIIGDPTQEIYVANFPWGDASSQIGVTPLPTIARSNIKIDGDTNNDGVQDVIVDFQNLPPTAPSFFGPYRTWGLRVAASSAVILEGLTLRMSAPNPFDIRQSVPAVNILSGNSHSVRGCSLTTNAIAVETTVAAGSTALIGSVLSSGYRNSFTGNSFAGLYIRHGGGTVIVQNNSFAANGTAAEPFSGGIVVETSNSGANLIGGTVSDAGNSISGNTMSGVVIRGSGANTLQQNDINNNTRNGVLISGSGDNRVGGSSSTAGNSINGNATAGSGFNHAGLYIDGNGNGDNVIEGNTFNANGGAGMQVDGDGANNIGGTASGARNHFTNNGALSSAESRSGIDIHGDNLNDGNNTIENNTISGNLHGVAVQGSGITTIGGSQAASSNTIASNTYNGIRLAHNGTSYIRGNLIGSSGANGVHGIEISDNADSVNYIGGTATAERNIISGNGSDGIAVNGGNLNVIYGNYLGINAAGTARQANGRNGITVSTNSTGSNTIGGRAPGQRNVISGNSGVGIAIQNTPSAGTNLIQGNYVGIDAAGVNAVGNSGGGILVSGAASGQTIGGSALGDGNIISGNGAGNGNSDGIELGGGGDNTVLGNLIGGTPVNPSGFPIDGRIHIEGSNENGGAGILIGSDATGTIQIGNSGAYEGNVIVNNGSHGVEASGSGTVTFYHNYLGAALDSTNSFAAMGNDGDGILISGSGSNILGADEEAPTDDPNTTFPNYIAGNVGNGVNIVGPGDNVLTNNRIGCDAAATTAAGNGANGVIVTGTGDNRLENNIVAANTLAGVHLFSVGTTTLLGNRVGRTASSEPAGLGNTTYGVYVPFQSPGRMVLGGNNAGDANTIAGNTLDGVRIEGGVTNDLQNNLIGTDTSGTLALANGESGVYLEGAQTTVTAVNGNTISGNATYGVNIISGTNALRRNKIGTSSNGLSGVGNGSHGIYIDDPNLPTVRQGLTIGERSIANVDNGNVISGNIGDGIHIVQAGGDNSGSEADDILIRNNRIGLDVSGQNAIANNGSGVRVLSSCNGRIQIGGPTEGDGNLIGGNTGWGVWFEGAFTYNPGLAQNNAPVVYGNLVGTNVQGEVAVANATGGLLFDVAVGALATQPRPVRIGDTRPGGAGFPFANQIAGNSGPGLQLQGGAWYEVFGNFIGTDAFAREELPNSGDGLYVPNTATGGVFVGRANDGTVAAPSLTLPVTRELTRRNIIAGNSGAGLNLGTSGFCGVANNLIGMRETVGTPLLPVVFDANGGNDGGGLLLVGGLAGGHAVVASNDLARSGATGGLVVSSNSDVDLDDNTVQLGSGHGLVLSGNGAYVATRNDLLNNTGHGCYLNNATGAVIGSSAVTGADDGMGNTITGNQGDGIASTVAGNNRYSANAIADNGVSSGTYNGSSLGIDVGDDGTTDNPAFKLNRLIKNGDNSWTVTGVVPTTTAALELYEADDPDSVPNANLSKHRGQVGQYLVRLTEANDLDSATNDLNAAGGTFVYTVPAGVILTADAGVLLTALAIDTNGETTEYARNSGLVSLTRSTLVVDPTSVPADGSTPATATVTVRDAIDTPLPGVPNVVITTAPAAGGDWTLTQPSTTTDLNGQATATILATARPDCGGSNPAANLITVGATVEGSALTPQTLALTLGDAAATRSDLDGPASPVTANGTAVATLTITLRDTGGTVGCAVPAVDPARLAVFQVVGGAPQGTPASELTITNPSAVTDANGQTTASVTSTKAGVYTFGFSIDGTNVTSGGNLVTADVTFVAGPPDAAGSQFFANPTTVMANGSATSTLTLTVVDANGNPVIGLDNDLITITANPTTGVLLAAHPTADTDANGQTTVTVAGTEPATVAFTADVNGVEVDMNPVVTFSVGAPSGNSSLVASTNPVTNPVAARPNAVDQVLLTATLRDDNDNPVQGIDVTITATVGVGITVVGPSAATDANGVATAIATASQINNNPAARFTATATVDVGGTPTRVTLGSADVQFRLLDPDPAQSTLSVATEDPLLANGQRRATVTVRLLDTAGDPLPGVRPDEFAIAQRGTSLAGLAIDPPTNSTDTNGETTFRLTSTTAGLATVGVTARNVLLNATASATFLPSITQSYGPGLHLMGVFGRPVQPDPRNVLRALLPGLQLARWDGGGQQYRSWNEFSPADPADPYNLAKNPLAMLAGRGFWLQLSSLTSFTAVGDPTPLTPFRMPLARGWNQVANPFPVIYPFRLNEITVLQNGTTVGTLASPAGRALVEPYGWRWDPVMQYLLLVDPATSAAATLNGDVAVGRGWWWLCRGDNVEVTLAAPTASRARVSRAAPTPAAWQATLEVTAPGGAAQALFGAGERLRAAAPPPAPVASPVTLSFVDTLGRAAGDVRRGPLTSRQVWQVEVESAPGEVTVAWAGLARALPAGHRAWLSDPTSGKRVLLNNSSAYTFRSTGGTRALSLEVDPRATRALNIVDLQAQAGRGRSRGVPISLTLSTAADLTLTVRGAAGRLVAQQSKAGVAGLNTLVWDAQDNQGRPVPAGNYVIEVTARGADGELARAVRTVTVR